MSLWQRMTRNIRADAHGVLDAIEDRVLLVKQHLREAEAAVQVKKTRKHALEQERELRQAHVERLEAECLQHEQDAELAIDSGQDALARYALAAWLSKSEARQRVAERLVAIDKECVALQDALTAQEPALAALRARVATFVREQDDRLAVDSADATLASVVVANERVEIELLRRKRARGDADAARELEVPHGEA